jgi:archaellum component FlaD/FlaE
MSTLRLEEIPESGRDRKEAIEWGQYLLTRFGLKDSLTILMSYEENGWISSEARRDMEDIIKDCVSRDFNEQHIPKEDTCCYERLKDTGFEPHSVSIEYIETIGDSREKIL